MRATVQDILAVSAKQAPPELAAGWDRVGLLLGSPRQEVTRLVVALEATAAVLQGAVESGAQMVLTHHPVFLQPLQRLNPDNPLDRPIAMAIRHDLAVAAAHTNLDAAARGLNAYLAHRLELTRVEPLTVTGTDPLLKLSVFVPVGYEDRVRQAVCRAGGGIVGNYAYCSFQCRGQGTYLPLAGAHPWQGMQGVVHRSAEVRLEILIPAGLAKTAVANLKAVHPYEEVAYDLYPLANTGNPYGFGCFGEWPEPRPFAAVVAALKEMFRTPHIKSAGKPRPAIQRLAVCGGSGGDLIAQAWEKGAELYITGDVRYHQAVPWMLEDLTILDLGHYATEVIFIPEWGRRLQADLEAAGWTVEVMVAEWDQDPFSYL